MRAMRAIENAPRAVAGNTSEARPSRPAAGNQSEPDREDHDQEQPQPVHGHGLAQQDAHRAHRVEQGVTPERGQDSRGHRHQQGEAETGGRQLERRGERLEDQREGGDLMLEREAEVSAHGAREEAEVLEPERVVEPEERAELPDILLARLERKKQARRVTGEVQEPEDDDRHAEEDQEAL